MCLPEATRTDAAPVRGARLIVVSGQVQGVGYRPFVLRLANRLGLAGTVRNAQGDVHILAEGDCGALAAFERGLVADAPPLARPRIAAVSPRTPGPHTGFAILPSAGARAGRADVHLVPDVAPCADCLAEMADPGARRHRYPFTNCTQCGPRYTIVRELPYDRATTSMAAFPLCPRCRHEFGDPDDRRFHAQPLACPRCGPTLAFRPADAAAGAGAEPVERCVAALRRGEIVAVKGVGGYRLMCDARSEGAVRRLRSRKGRPDKPLAVLFAQAGRDGLDAVRQAAELDPIAAAAMLGPSRPIVVCPRRPDSHLAPSLSPGCATLGAMLPTSPLDHLLADAFGGPLVATSGNLSGEPMLTDDGEAETRLAAIADAFLGHDRPIVRPADDPVLRVIAGAARAVRLGRGTAPLEIPLPHPLPEPVLALGGQQKIAIALGAGERAIVSPHLGDFGAPRTERLFRETVADFCALHGIEPRRIVCDAHPHYRSTRWARQQRLPRREILHHHAHASAIAGEYPGVARWLVFAWDAAGLGADGTLWGGETFHGAPGRWRRVASLRPFRLPGGERAARQPWRSAAALTFETRTRWTARNPAMALAHEGWRKGINAPTTSAVGRLFDAAAAFVLGLEHGSHEGHGPMLLEAVAAPGCPVPLPRAQDADGIVRLDWEPLLPVLMDGALAPAERAGILHATLAAAVAGLARDLRRTMAFDAVGLTGGVFQNRRLAEDTLARLAADGIPALLPSQLPANDGGLAFGQLVEAGALDRRG